jgi:hypothetical protein
MYESFVLAFAENIIHLRDPAVNAVLENGHSLFREAYKNSECL